VTETKPLRGDGQPRPGPGGDALTPQHTTELEDFVKTTFSGLLRYLRRLGSSHALSEDIAQDAYIAAMRNWVQVRELKNPRAWLYIVARNLLVSALRKEARRISLDHAPLEPWDPSSPDIATSVVNARAMFDAMARLPDRQREAIVLKFFNAFTVDEISSALGIAPATVRSQLRHARTKLAEQLSTASSERNR
jgi:RNA polymerase sigma factor (sigma-70 family)